LCTSRLALQDEQSFRLVNPRKGCFLCLQACEDGGDEYTVARGPPFESRPSRIVLPHSFQRAIDLPTESISLLSLVLTGRLLLSLAGYRCDLIELVRDISVRGCDKRINVTGTSMISICRLHRRRIFKLFHKASPFLFTALKYPPSGKDLLQMTNTLTPN
jgi:hypothetical protein